MRYLNRFFLFAALLLLAGCRGTEERIVIISTNDIHSSIDNFPRLATLVKMEREANPDRVILVDAGDRWTGNPFVDRAPVKYGPVIGLMNELGFDIATFGNHEWDSGEEILAQRIGEAGFINVMANIETGSTSVPGVVPYAVIESGGLRIAFIGLVGIEENGYPIGFRENFAGTVFRDPYKVAREYSFLRNEADLYVALTHMGYEPDSILARQHPEFDLIIGGHSHTRIDRGININGVIVTQTKRNLEFAGITTVSYRKGKVKHIDNRLVALADILPDREFQHMVDRYNNEPALLEKVGEVDGELDRTGLLNLFSDIMRIESKADFAFYNVGGMRLEELDEGNIRKADVYKAEPFDNKPVIVSLTIDEIAGFIMNKFNSSDKESHMLDLYPSGLRYEIVTDNIGDATDIFIEHDFYPEQGKRYKVVMSDYVNESYKFAGQNQGVPIGGTIADQVFSYLEMKSPVEADNESRVTIN